jgi:hypothetical protein
MSHYIYIPDVLISLVKKTEVNTFEEGLQQINIIYHFFVESINNQIQILNYMNNTKLINLEDLNQLEDKPINDYSSFQNVRKYFLMNHEFLNYPKFQKHILNLLKTIEVLYYSDYEIENLEEILKDIEHKINYMDEYKEKFETLEGDNKDKYQDIDIDSYKEYELTYDTLKYLYSVYTEVLNMC